MSVKANRGFLRRAGLSAFLGALVLALSAATALASVKLSPHGAYSPSEPTTITVSGKASGKALRGATDVAIAVCDIEPTAEPGTRCDIGSATPGLEPIANYQSGIEISLRRGPWTNFDFTTGAPFPSGGETTCENQAGEGEQCGVVVSFYEVNGPEVKQLGSQVKKVKFKKPPKVKH